MEIFMNFDLKSMSKRIEPNKVDPYCIDLEDYENINDLIDRSIRTKTKFEPEHVPGAVYDSDKDIADQLEQTQNIDQFAPLEQAETAETTDAEQSEAKEVSSSDEASNKAQMPIG